MWLEGRTSVQIYVVPLSNGEFNAAFGALVDSYDPVVRGSVFAAYLSPVPRKWLHMTVRPLAGWASDYPPCVWQRLDAALRSDLAEMAPVTVTAGPALCGSAGVLVDVDQTGPGEALTVLYQRVRAAVTTAIGADAVAGTGWPPHITLAYGTQSIDSGLISSALRRIRPGRSPLTINAVRLVEVTQDPHQHQYRWREHAVIPLGDIATM